MEKGLNYTTKSIIKELNSTERYQEVELFCQETSTENYIEYKDTNQIEYVINSGSLSRVLDVTIDKENNRAYLKLLLIPRSLWDPYQLETSLKK